MSLARPGFGSGHAAARRRSNGASGDEPRRPPPVGADGPDGATGSGCRRGRSAGHGAGARSRHPTDRRRHRAGWAARCSCVLTAAGARLVDRFGRPASPPPAPTAQRLARRLLDAGMAHPRSARWPGPIDPADVAVVIPVRDRPDRRPVPHSSVPAGRQPAVGGVVVVDDGSIDPRSSGWRRSRADGTSGSSATTGSRGPAAARNTGWRAARAPVSAFVDADVEPEPGWLPDPRDAPVRPGRRGGGAAGRRWPRSGTAAWLAAYEAGAVALDLGGAEATVRPGSRVPYVPTAALLVSP